jgi:hypothetical protein
MEQVIRLTSPRRPGTGQPPTWPSCSPASLDARWLTEQITKAAGGPA